LAQKIVHGHNRAAVRIAIRVKFIGVNYTARFFFGIVGAGVKYLSHILFAPLPYDF
jgi:hypothetical protein